MSVDDPQQVADDLYALPLAEFTAQRNARAKDLRAGGNRELADQVSRLPKPTVAAWAVNALVRDRAEQVDDVLALGAMLREAQEELDPGALRTLTQQRRQLVAALGREAARIAAGRGQQLSAAVIEELEQTLQAAMTDAAAAAALRTGRLLRSLSGTGLEAVDLTDAVAQPGGAPLPVGRRSGAPPPDEVAAARTRRDAGREQKDSTERARAEQEQAEERARAEREQVERELARARREVDEADAAAGHAERALREVERRREEHRGRREGLRSELRRLKAELAEAEQLLIAVEGELEGLETERDAAARSADRARLAADRSEEEVRRLEDRLGPRS